jgi:signal transduction histidine kinase/ActR/RegA family two-component response regulator
VRVSVRLRIQILVLCVVCSCLAAAAWAVATTYGREKSAMEQALRETARALALVVDRELGRREAVAWTLATSPSLRSGDLQAFHQQAVQATAGMGGWVVLFGPDGMLVNTSLPHGAELPKRRDGQRTVRVTDSGATISDLFRGPATGKWVMAISVPVKQPGVSGHGVSIVVPAENMQRVIDDQKLAPGWIAAIADRQGSIVARQPDPLKWLGHSVTPELAQRLKADPEGFVQTRSLDGSAATAFFSTSPNYKWAFVIGVPDALLGASLRRSVIEAGAIAVLLLVVAGAAAAIVGRRIAVPAQRLQMAAESLRAGTPIAYEPAGVTELDVAGATLIDAGTKLLEANHAIEKREHERDAFVQRLQSQLARMDLLHQITRAIGDRLDLASVFQVVCNSIERQMQVRLCAVALYDSTRQSYDVSCLGAHSRTLIADRGVLAAMAVDANGLSACVQGHLVCEADLARTSVPFARTLSAIGLRSAVLAPLQVQNKPFGLLLAARDAFDGFSSGDCEFLRQLSEHVALAAHQVQLYGALHTAYDDLRKTQQAAMQQERLRALGQMASGIAHDINNAISPIALYTENLLEREPGLSAKARDVLQTISRAIDDVASTVARMREFYRQRESPLALAPLALNPLVHHVVDLTRARWSDMPQQRGVAIDLHLELADELPQALGIEGEIREALINLVFNAIDAMPEGGELTLRTRSVGGALPARAQVEVSDTGVGMDDDTRRRCLEPFFTTKGERGTGLGLAMVYGMVQRLGAEIEIRSDVGRGTTVTLRFAAADSAASVAAAPVAAAAPATQRLHILVVDDDLVVLETLQRLLEADGHVVVAANAGQAGIDAFNAAHARGEAFSLVLTDLGMPHVDGRKVAGAVKQTSPSTPVLMLTGWGQGLGTDGTALSCVDQILGKPPKLAELRQALSRHTGSA